MSMARFLVVLLVGGTLLAGVGAWYLTVYAYYDRLPAQDTVLLTPLGAAAAQDHPVTDFEGIDSDSSPIRYRACFTLDADPAQFTPYPDAAPLIAPNWFDCFDAHAIGAALEEGRATAILGQGHLEYGIDRVVAVFPDGRAFAWHQINPCGEAHFDGDPLPPGCPPPPDR